MCIGWWGMSELSEWSEGRAGVLSVNSSPHFIWTHNMKMLNYIIISLQYVNSDIFVIKEKGEFLGGL